MTIFIRTSGGGGVVLVVALALLASHGGGISAALAAVVIALAVAVALAVAGLGAYLVYRARREAPRPNVIRLSNSGVKFSPPGGVFLTPGFDTPPALEQPAVRLHPDQLAELAEILRRGQRPE
jgi:hypothetical protein